MSKLLLLTVLITTLLGSWKPISNTGSAPAKITVAAYYFPNYHTGDPRNASYKGKEWSEWELVKTARPRFAGHHQPNIPAWGYTDEKDPKVMAKKIKTAVDHGIDCFIFDWYMYQDGPFLNRCIDEGFLHAKNCKKIKFGLMWANHDWVDIHPYTRGTPQKLLYPGKVSPQRFEEIGDLLINEYFLKPNYWKIDVWIHHVALPTTQTDYNFVRDAYFTHWDKAKSVYGVPYFPNVTMGWDPTPRCDLKSEWANVGYPFMNTIGNNTPENFRTALQMTKEKLLTDPHGPRILNINCWNEWTEGSYLEPDTKNGLKYLEAVKEVFGSKK